MMTMVKATFCNFIIQTMIIIILMMFDVSGESYSRGGGGGGQSSAWQQRTGDSQQYSLRHCHRRLQIIRQVEAEQRVERQWPRVITLHLSLHQLHVPRSSLISQQWLQEWWCLGGEDRDVHSARQESQQRGLGQDEAEARKLRDEQLQQGADPSENDRTWQQFQRQVESVQNHREQHQWGWSEWCQDAGETRVGAKSDEATRSVEQ